MLLSNSGRKIFSSLCFRVGSFFQSRVVIIKMLAKVLFAALLGLCCASFLENGFKKLAPIRNDVQRFAMSLPEEATDKVQSKWGSKTQDLITKLRSSLLLRGTPLASFRPQQMLPLFVRIVLAHHKYHLSVMIRH